MDALAGNRAAPDVEPLRTPIPESGRDAAVHGSASMLPAVQAGLGESAPGAVAPLSHGQRALWFLQQLAPESPAYHIVTAVRMPGEIDVAVFRRAFERLVERHPPLGAAFITRDNEPFQQFLRRPIDVREEDVVGWSDAQLHTLLDREIYRPFNLEHDPLLRITLLKRSSHERMALVVLHHIVTDLWSMAVLLHEIDPLYRAETTGVPAVLPQPASSYSDYINWQTTMLAGPRGEELASYWLQQLAGELPVLNLPTDRPRPSQPSYRGASCSIRLDAALTQALRALAATHHATLYMTVLAAFQVLLYRYSGQDDILVGSPWAGRRRKWANLIGYFVNPLVLRANLAGNPPFSVFLQQVRQTAKAAFDHADYPFALLVRQLRPEREISHSPIFQVMFSWQKATRRISGADLTLFALNESGGQLGEALTLEALVLEQRVAPFDLLMLVGESGDELVATLEYSTDLFDASTAERMLGHFKNLLDGIVANPETPLDCLPILSPEERHQILVEWNATEVAYPQDVCLHQLIAEQAARTPAAPALRFEGQALSYGELERRANQLARHLQGLGVGPGSLVALCVERSFELVIGLLGILKAGGAYVPLDPGYPAERLAFMLRDCAAPVVLTRQSVDYAAWSAAPGLEAGQPVTVVDLERDWPLIARQPEAAPESAVSAEQLAYVIYTSGSTGQPKGAMIAHRAIVNRLLWMQDAYQLTPADRVLQKTPFTFDVSVWEFFWPLLTGACLVIARPEGHKDTSYLVDLIETEQITTLHFVPPMLQVFLAEADIGRCGSLRRVICSGEALAFDLQQRFYTLLDAELHNLYGPTEAAVDVSFWACEREPTRPIVPIGRPVANTQLFILDRQLQPVPIGVAGELHIGGIQLAEGYLNRPELSAEKFIASPWQATTRLYKTGDLARYLEDGAIEYLGRLDHQVKVRGFRIELSEIEATLAGHPAVREVVVLAREDTPGHRRLIAYVVPVQQPGPDARELRQFVQAKLPEYMVPAVIVFLDALPLTSNGKVNRRGLPAPEESSATREGDYTAPGTPAELTLARIWEEVLRVERVSIHDNFFELGGDSILSIQVVGRANRAGLRLTPAHMFQFPTLARLAAAAQSGPTVPIEENLAAGQVALTPIQHWFFEQNLPEPHHWNQAVLLEVRQPLSRQHLADTLGYLLRHHDALRLRFMREGTEWRQINTGDANEEPAIAYIDLSAQNVTMQRTTLEATAAEVQASLTLERGPLLRAVYFDLGPERPGRLLFVAHHLVIDGFSWRVLLEDFETVYTQLSQGQQPLLPPRTTAFQSWAWRLSQPALLETVGAELDYWQALLTDQIAPLPGSRKDRPNTEADTRLVHVTLSEEATRQLLQQAPALYGTNVNEILLTALAQALSGWSGKRCHLIDLEGHGRVDLFADVDLSRTIGWFTTIFPVVLHLAATPDPGALLIQLKEQLRRIPRQGIGYGLLRYLSDSATRERIRSLPSAEVRFNYLGQFDQNLAASALFAQAYEHYGPLHSPHGQRRYVLEIDSMVTGGQLHVEWAYSQQQYDRIVIEGLAEMFLEALQQLLAHCDAQQTRVYTPSDFPLVELNQQQLDTISTRLRRAVKGNA